MSVLRLGVIADPHLALERVENASWHNPYRLADAHERLDAALAHPLLDSVDVIALLGDLAHFGDRTSVRYVVDAVGSGDRPAVLLSGNHDVLTPGVRLEDEVRASGADHVLSPLAWEPEAPALKAFDAAGAGLAAAKRSTSAPPTEATYRKLCRAIGVQHVWALFAAPVAPDHDDCSGGLPWPAACRAFHRHWLRYPKTFRHRRCRWFGIQAIPRFLHQSRALPRCGA